MGGKAVSVRPRHCVSVPLSWARQGKAGQGRGCSSAEASMKQVAQARPAGPRGGCPVGVSHSLYMPEPPGGVSRDSSTQ